MSPQIADYICNVTVWVTPLIIGLLARSQLRQPMPLGKRFMLWAGYCVWTVGWLFLWFRITNRTRDLSSEEIVFVAGCVAMPVLGAVLMAFAELSRWRARQPQGFEVLMSKGTTRGENSNSR